jgi:hypothetical protein
MSDEKSKNIHPGKAIFAVISTVVFLIVLPYLLITELLPTYFPMDPTIQDQLLNSLILFGAIGAVISFFKALWSKGTRPHGLISAVFAAYSVYYLYFLFSGGFSGEFGVFRIELGSLFLEGTLESFSFGVNFSYLAWWFIIAGGISVALYIYEAIA